MELIKTTKHHKMMPSLDSQCPLAIYKQARTHQLFAFGHWGHLNIGRLYCKQVRPFGLFSTFNFPRGAI